MLALPYDTDIFTRIWNLIPVCDIIALFIYVLTLTLTTQTKAMQFGRKGEV